MTAIKENMSIEWNLHESEVLTNETPFVLTCKIFSFKARYVCYTELIV